MLFRSVRYYYSCLGHHQPLLHKLIPVLADQFAGVFPELKQQQDFVVKVVKEEEEAFLRTLDKGLKRMDELMRTSQQALIPGKAAFELYDTYGFPLDLTQDALRAQGREVETAGFDKAMAKQREDARAAWSGSGDVATEKVWFELREQVGATEFLGYDTEGARSEEHTSELQSH